MDIYFLRHGEAEEKSPGTEDKDIPLTSKGAAAISDMSRFLKKKLKAFDLVLTSPLLRARQTADIVSSILDCKGRIKESDNLLVGSTPLEFLDELKGYKGIKHLLVVGHQPHLGVCVAYLTETSEEETGIKKGGSALVSIDSLKKGKGRLVWLKAPTDFK